MSKAIIFSRVSTVGQKLESQIDVTSKYATELGYDEQIIISEKESGLLKERNGIKRMLEEDNIDAVIVYELSRLSRRPKDLYELRDYFLEHNIQLHCMTPKFNLITDGKLDMMANIVFGLFTSMAENECLLRSERCRRGREKAKQENKWLGGRIPYGYKLQSGNIEIVPEQAEIIRYLYDNKYVRLNQLVDNLLSKGIFTNINRSSAYQNVRRILKYEDIYKGLKAFPSILI